MKEDKFIIKRGLFDFNSRELIINHEHLSFENKDKFEDLKTIFKKNEIISYRYGIKWYSLHLTYAREYQIYILNKNNQVIKIDFTNYFGNNKKESFAKYNSIKDALWENYFQEIAKQYFLDFFSNKTIKLNGITISKKFIEFESSKLMSKDKVQIEWKNVRVKNYQTYFSVFSAENPGEINFHFNYLNDWNVDILYSVMNSILKYINKEDFS